MKYFFRRRFPGADDVLLIESGSPEVARRALGKIREHFPGARYHLLTCRPVPSQVEGAATTPESRLAPAGPYRSVFCAADYPTSREKLRLLLSLARRKWRVLAILCTGEPVLWRWKMLALALFPSKVLIVNENADFFWVDWAHRRHVRQFLAVRWGVNRGELAATALRALVFPLTLLFLILTAFYLYARRWRRLLVWKLRPVRAKALAEPAAEVSEASRSNPR